MVILNTPNQQGSSRKSQLEGARKSARKRGVREEELAVKFKELEPVEVERGIIYLISIFEEVSSTRPQGFNGPLPITYLELKAYCELSETHLEAWEVDMIRAMDHAFLDEVWKMQQKQAKGKK